MYGSKLSKIGGPGNNRLILLYFPNDCNVESTSPPTTPLPTPSPTTTYPISLYPNASRIITKGTTIRLFWNGIWTEAPDSSTAIQVKLPPSNLLSTDNPMIGPFQQVLIVYSPMGKNLNGIITNTPYFTTIMLYFATDCRINNRPPSPTGLQISLNTTQSTVQRYKGGILILKRTGSTYAEVT